MTIFEALSLGRERLADVDDPGREARVLLAHAAGVTTERLALLDEVDGASVALYRRLLDSRVAKRPLARILGYRDFWTHRFEIDDSVLDPRADTENLVAHALDRSWNSVLDLGTGSGCILLSLLSERPGTRGMGTDVSRSALRVARRNAERLGLADRARMQQSDWYCGIDARFDLIVSNPPYIAADEMPGLSDAVRCHDPALALTDEGSGLSAYRTIAGGAAAHLNDGGCVMVEIGWRQRAAVEAIFARSGLCEITCHADLEGRDRVVSARKS